jgi:hypothetical protein
LIHVGVRKDELVDIPAGKPGKFRLLGWCEQGYKRCNLVGTFSLESYFAKFFAAVSARHDFEGQDQRPSIDDLRSWLVRSLESRMPIPEYLNNSQIGVVCSDLGLMLKLAYICETGDNQTRLSELLKSKLDQMEKDQCGIRHSPGSISCLSIAKLSNDTKRHLTLRN